MNFKDFFRDFYRPDSNTESDPSFFYHATNEENLWDIKSSGVLEVFPPNHGTEQDSWPDGSEDNRSYWTDRASLAWQFAPELGRPVILRTPKSHLFRREAGTGDYYTSVAVPVNLLEVRAADGSWVAVSSI